MSMAEPWLDDDLEDDDTCPDCGEYWEECVCLDYCDECGENFEDCTCDWEDEE
jgi:hypothetical protein